MGDTPYVGSPRSRSQDSRCTNCNSPEDLLRRKLKYYFMNPCQKWRAKKKLPWKLVLQVIKIILVTIQLWMFGLSRSSHLNFLKRSTISFQHLYVLNWSSALETMPYPPTAGTFAIYEIPQFYDSVNYAMRRYDATEDIAIGSYRFVRENKNSPIPPMEMCNNHYNLTKDLSTNETKFDRIEVHECFNVLPLTREKNGTVEKIYDIEKFLDNIDETIIFDGVNMIQLRFNLTAIHLNHHSHLSSQSCFLFKVKIEYDNRDHNGQMKVTLTQDYHQEVCVNGEHWVAITIFEIFSVVFDCIVILISILSCALCIRSMYRAHRLKTQTVNFFKNKLHKELAWHDRFEFVNMWFVLITINDVLTVLGSGFKVALELRATGNYEACGILLGTGSLLVWFGVLRYLSFFEKYNILILTMKRSAPSVLRFLVCAAMFYLGFTVCGWVVLGPYHIKFQTFSSASECLFSLVNGDDMYVTFAAIDTNNYVWWYSRIYLYIFVSLFIYVILSVFISVIMDTYETIKMYYEEGFPKSVLEQFIEECTDDAHSLFRSYSTDRFRAVTGNSCSCVEMCSSCSCDGLGSCLPNPLSCCHCQRGEDENDDDLNEYGSLIT